ncbi:MAG: lytic transglycosylase domain-containing protein [Pyrinomonadaceae bacterium]|nr:lytic transglycosylase domain-containing protein [Pyrinomonadaceae bacterium]
MTKFSLMITMICLLAASANSQIRNRLVIDNFDLASGVSVKPTATPVATPAPQPSKKLVKKTVQNTRPTMSMQDAVSLKDSPVTNNKLTMSKGSSMGGFTTGDSVIDSYIVDSSNRYGIDPLLIYAQMSQESSFKLNATSYKGARGLMQLMPATAARFGVTNIYEPRQNIDAGVKYMRWLLDTFNGDVNLALAGYNAGEGAVMKYGWQIPPYNETQEYVRRISNRYNSIRNPNYVRTVKKVTATEAVKLEKKEAAPLTVYEVNPIAVRLPDGRMRLVNK